MVGIILLVLYYVKGKQVMKEVGFSTFIKNTPVCAATGEPQAQAYANTVEASNACKADDTCQAFDWQGIEIAQNGTYTALEDPVTRFYSSVPDKCKMAIKPDNVKLLRYPTFFQNDLDPNTLAVPGVVKKGTCTSIQPTGCGLKRSSNGSPEAPSPRTHSTESLGDTSTQRSPS